MPSPGKQRGLRRLADEKGRFKMLAIDQRPPMLKHISQRLGRPAGYAELSEVKALLAHHLAPRSSAVLVDPDYGYARVEPEVSAKIGLIVAVEDFRFEENEEGRRTGILPEWSVERIKRIGADGVKLLLWYRPDASLAVREHQQELVRQVGAECRTHDIAFLLEPLTYPLLRDANHNTDYKEFAGKQAELVLESVRTFAHDDFGVDVFKVESPYASSDLPVFGSDASGPVLETFRQLGREAGRPWVMLSGGGSPESFERVLQYACSAGASGYLAGRAIWGNAFDLYPDNVGMTNALAGDAGVYMDRINALVDWQRPSVRIQNPASAATSSSSSS